MWKTIIENLISSWPTLVLVIVLVIGIVGFLYIVFSKSFRALRVVNNVLREDNDSHKAEIRGLKSDIRELKSDINDLSVQVSILPSLKEKVRIQSMRIDELVRKVKEADTAYSEALQQLDNLGTVVSELTQALDNANPDDRYRLHKIEKELENHGLELVRIAKLMDQIKNIAENV